MTTTSEQQPTDVQTPLTDSCFNSSHAYTHPSGVEAHVIFTLQILSFVVYKNKATCVSDLYQRGLQSHLCYPRGNVIFNFSPLHLPFVAFFRNVQLRGFLHTHFQNKRLSVHLVLVDFPKTFLDVPYKFRATSYKQESRLSIPRGLRRITE